MESILRSVRRRCGADPDQDYFDPELIADINAAFGVLAQLGAGPPEGFAIQDETALWSDFSGDINTGVLESYVTAKVKLMFDPPTSSFALESLQKLADEFEWRTYMNAKR